MGFPHPDYLRKLLTSKQIEEWIAYHGIEPFGPHAEELRFGVLGATIASVYSSKKSKTPKPIDFTVSMRSEKEKKEPRYNKELPSQLKEMFGANAIPSNEWNRKKKMRKGK